MVLLAEGLGFDPQNPLSKPGMTPKSMTLAPGRWTQMDTGGSWAGQSRQNDKLPGQEQAFCKTSKPINKMSWLTHVRQRFLMYKPDLPSSIRERRVEENRFLTADL